MKFEIHLTFYFKDACLVVGPVGRALKWKSSTFEGDPILGVDKYFYLTKYASSKEQALGFIAEAKKELDIIVVPLIREKIEEIVHDVRHIDVRNERKE
jgi:hypothetical protein